MRATTVKADLNVISLATKAAEAFAKNNQLTVYSGLEPGGYLAARFGQTNDVLVVKLDNSFDPTVFCDLIGEVPLKGSPDTD